MLTAGGSYNPQQLLNLIWSYWAKMTKPPSFSIDERIIRLVAEKTGVKPAKLTMESRLVHDLGVDGDDAAELISAFEEEFGVDMSSFELSTHLRTGPTLLSVFCFLPSQKKSRPTTKVPITLGNLAEAATLGRWNL